MPPVAIAVFVLLNLLTVYKSSITPDNFFTNTLRETRNALAQYDNFSAQKNARQKILGSLKSLPKNAAGVYVLDFFPSDLCPTWAQVKSLRSP